MTESGLQNDTDALNRTSFRAVPIAPQPFTQLRAGRDIDISHDKTFPGGSTKEPVRSGNIEPSEEDSIEMANYAAPPQSPVDFTRSHMI